MTRWLQTDFAGRRRPLWRRLQTWWTSLTGATPAVTPPALDQDTVWRELREGLVFNDPAGDLHPRWDLESASPPAHPIHHSIGVSDLDPLDPDSPMTTAGPDFTSFDPAVNPYVYTGIAPLDPTALMGESDRFGHGGGSGHHSSSLSVFRHDD